MIAALVSVLENVIKQVIVLIYSTTIHANILKDAKWFKCDNIFFNSDFIMNTKYLSDVANLST